MIKIKKDAIEALQVVKDGDVILVGGFGLVGSPLTLIEGLTNIDAKELTIVSNNLGESGKGLGKVLNQKKIKKESALILPATGMWERPTSGERSSLS